MDLQQSQSLETCLQMLRFEFKYRTKVTKCVNNTKHIYYLQHIQNVRGDLETAFMLIRYLGAKSYLGQLLEK